jgi:hypothetical protein
MPVSLTLALIGTDDEPRWVTDVRPGGRDAPHWNYCCQDGHYTPEGAAGHGAELAAAAMARAARNLRPPACGALAIQKLETAA